MEKINSKIAVVSHGHAKCAKNEMHAEGYNHVHCSSPLHALRYYGIMVIVL